MNKMSLNLSSPDSSPRQGSVSDITRAVDWRSWSAASDEAHQRRVPMLVLAEPAWSNSAQRLAHVIGENEGLRNSLNDRVVPVFVDPHERPDLAALWRWAAVALTGSSGPPLMLLLTHEGLPFLSYGTMQFEGDDVTPSLASLVTATADAYAEHMDSFVQEGRSLVASHSEEHFSGFTSFADYWNTLKPDLDNVHGGLHELPRHPHPQLLWSALSESGASDHEDDIAAWVRTTLQHMVNGGMNDQLDQGFHRCARDERWVVPHFEKPVPLNVQLCAVYARAAHHDRNERFREVAQDLASFCVTALREHVDCVGSDSGYYTWTAKELLDGLDAEYVQPMSLYFGVVPSPLRQALHRAIRVEHLGQYSREDPEVLRARVERGRKQLRAFRRHRPAPELVIMAASSWRAETLRWLFVASEWLPDLKQDVLAASLDTLIEQGMHPQLGYVRSGDEKVGWLEDQAALLGAMVAALRTTGDEHWRTWSHALADVVVREYRTEDGWSDRAGGGATSKALVDDILPAPIATLTASLMELESPENGYGDIARTQAAHYLSAASMTGPRGAAFWRALEGTQARK